MYGLYWNKHSLFEIWVAWKMLLLETVQRWSREVHGSTQHLKTLNLYWVEERLLRRDIIKYWQFFMVTCQFLEMISFLILCWVAQEIMTSKWLILEHRWTFWNDSLIWGVLTCAMHCLLSLFSVKILKYLRQLCCFSNYSSSQYSCGACWGIEHFGWERHLWVIYDHWKIWGNFRKSRKTSPIQHNLA